MQTKGMEFGWRIVKGDEYQNLGNSPHGRSNVIILNASERLVSIKIRRRIAEVNSSKVRSFQTQAPQNPPQNRERRMRKAPERSRAKFEKKWGVTRKEIGPNEGAF